MNKNLKKILVTGAALLMFASVGAGLQSNANASHHVGWRQITRTANLKVNRGKRIHLRKNQRVYVIKLAKNQKSAQIKIGRNYYNVNTKLLAPSQAQWTNKKANNKKPNYRKAIKRHKRANRRINRKHARKFNRKKQRNVKQLVKRANNKRRRNHKRVNKRSAKVLKPKYRRSNNARLLRNSGFLDLRAFGPDIMNKYAPNSRKAVIPKNVNIKDIIWLKGHILQKNPTAYAYNAKAHGWVQLQK